MKEVVTPGRTTNYINYHFNILLRLAEIGLDIAGEEVTIFNYRNSLLHTKYNKYVSVHLKNHITTLFLNIASRQRNDQPINISIFRGTIFNRRNNIIHFIPS